MKLHVKKQHTISCTALGLEADAVFTVSDTDGNKTWIVITLSTIHMHRGVPGLKTSTAMVFYDHVLYHTYGVLIMQWKLCVLVHGAVHWQY